MNRRQGVGRQLLWSLCLLGSLAVLRPSEGHSQENPYAENYFRMLADRGISTDAEGLRAFLASQTPGPEDAPRLAQQMADLGHDDYARREAAMQALLSRPPRSLDGIEKLAAGNDPEVRWRARLILDSLRQPGNDLLYASLIVINSRKIGGLADAVVGVAPLCKSDSMQLAMSRALVATATRKDFELLKTNLASEDERIRMACVNALIEAVGETAVPEILPLIEDRSDHVRFEAATQLLPFRRGESLRTFGKLLHSEHLTVRNRSIHKLRSTLKVSLPYSGYEPLEDRTRHAAEWQKTIDANLQDQPPATTNAARAPLTPQIALHASRHQTLILIGRDGSLQNRELKRLGERITVTPDGNLLSLHPSSEFVTEIDAAGATVWRSKALDERPVLAVRKQEGTTLVATAEGSLIELNAAGDMIRKAEVGIIVDFELLPDGGALLLSFERSWIRQVDISGRVLWQESLPAPPTSMCIAGDGHALVALQGFGQMIDIDLETKKVRMLPFPFRSPTQIEQLADGRLAVVDAAGAHLADRQGSLIETIRLFPNSSAGF